MASRCLNVDRSGTPGEGAASLLRETLELRDRELAAARQQLSTPRAAANTEEVVFSHHENVKPAVVAPVTSEVPAKKC